MGLGGMTDALTINLDALENPKPEHGWDCFRTSGGYTNAMEFATPLSERIEAVYKTAYATGLRNGKRRSNLALIAEVRKLRRDQDVVGVLIKQGDRMAAAIMTDDHPQDAAILWARLLGQPIGAALAALETEKP